MRLPLFITATARKRGVRMGKVKKFSLNLVKALILPAAMLVLFVVLSRLVGKSEFGSWDTIRTILQQTMMGSCIALAMTCNMINNRWDFSIGLMLVLSSIIAAPIAQVLHIGAAGLVLCSVAAAMLLSLINAGIYLLIRVPTLVISIGLMIAYESFALVWADGKGAKIADQSLLLFGRSPWVFCLGLAAILVFYLLFSKSVFGYNVRTLAGNQALGVSSGIRESRNLLGCYLVCGLMLGIAATINQSAAGRIPPELRYNGAMGIMFEAFPAVFIGLYLTKYTNLTFGVMIGAFTMKLLTAGMLSLGIPAAMQSVGLGIFLVVFMAITSNQAKMGEMRNNRERLKRIAKTA